MRKGRKSTKGLVMADGVVGGPGKGAANADMVEYTPPMVLDDISRIKHRLTKASYKGHELSKLAKVFTVEALTVLVECVQDKDHSMADRIRASEIILNRGWGRAKEHVQVDNNTSITVSAPDIMALINARRSTSMAVIDAIDIDDENKE